MRRNLRGRFEKMPSLIVFIILAGTISPAFGAGTSILILHYDSTYDGTSLENHYESLGLIVDKVTSLPAGDLSSYKIIFVLKPTIPILSAQVTQLRDWVTRGGRLVLVGDDTDHYNYSSYLNGVLAELGVPISFNSDSFGNSYSCVVTSNITADQTTTGLSQIAVSETNSLSTNSPATVLIRAFTQNHVIAAVGQPSGALSRPGADVVVLADYTLISTGCVEVPLAVKKLFWTNLYDFQFGPTCHATMNQTNYFTGDKVTLQSWSMSNPGSTSLIAEYKLWNDRPDGTVLLLARGGADDSFVLPPGYSNPNILSGPITIETVTETTPPRGIYWMTCRFMNPSTGSHYVFDRTLYSVDPF